MGDARRCRPLFISADDDDDDDIFLPCMRHLQILCTDFLFAAARFVRLHVASVVRSIYERGTATGSTSNRNAHANHCGGNVSVTGLVRIRALCACLA